MAETIVDVCEERLRGAILAGELAPGTRLPAERDLAARFGIHRASVRTALARLTASGLVVARQGSGYEVQPWRRSGGPDLLRDLLALASGEALEDAAADLLRVRRALASVALETLAGDPPDAEARARIAQAIDALEALVSIDAPVDAVARADLAVVAAVVAATGSAVLELCTNPIASLVLGAPRLRDAIYDDAGASVLAWRALAAWTSAPSAAGLPAILGALEARDAQTLARLRGHAGARRDEPRGPAPKKKGRAR